MAGSGLNASGSDLYVKQTSTGAGTQRVPTRDMHGKKRVAFARVVVGAETGTGTGGAVVTGDEINLVNLPANARLLLDECKIKFSATQGAGTFVHLGHRAYRDRGGNLVAEDQTAVLGNWDASTTVLETFPVSTTALGANVDVLQTLKFDSQGVVPLYMTAAPGGTYDGDVGDTYDFKFVYVTD